MKGLVGVYPRMTIIPVVSGDGDCYWVWEHPQTHCKSNGLVGTNNLVIVFQIPRENVFWYPTPTPKPLEH